MPGNLGNWKGREDRNNFLRVFCGRNKDTDGLNRDKRLWRKENTAGIFSRKETCVPPSRFSSLFCPNLWFQPPVPTYSKALLITPVQWSIFPIPNSEYWLSVPIRLVLVLCALWHLCMLSTWSPGSGRYPHGLPGSPSPSISYPYESSPLVGSKPRF